MALLGTLLGVPEPNELDENGCYSHGSIAELEHALIRSVEEGLEGDRTEPAPLHLSQEARWALISALQKAIRFEMVDYAGWVADQLGALDLEALRRRLAVIAIEDVAAGDPLASAQALAVLGARDWRRGQGEQRVLRWLARKLAAAHGDRSAAELLDSAHSDPRVVWTDLDALDERAMCRIVDDPDRPFALRSAVAQLMAGPRFAIGDMPTATDRSPTPLFQLIVEMGTSRWGCYVAAMTASRVRNVMWTQLPIIDRWVREGSPTVVPGPDFPKSLIGGILGAAYDCHTRQGNAALRRFGSLPAMDRVLAGVEPRHRWAAIGDAVFYGEGAILAHRVVWSPESQAVYDWIRLGPEWVRWRRPELAPELLPATRASLHELNAIRSDVLRSWGGHDR